jgi:hypothetical protein
MPAETPGMMTQYENLIDGENVVEDKLISNDKEQAMLATENLGLEFGPANKSRTTGEIIDLLDADKDGMLDNIIRDDGEVKVKEGPQQEKVH